MTSVSTPDAGIEHRDPKVLDLDGLAEAVDEEHARIESAMREAVAHAVEAGRLLHEAKTRVEHGQWEDWIEDNCTVAVRTAQMYMRVADQLPELPDEKAQRVASLPLREIDHVLRDKGSSEGDTTGGEPDGPEPSGTENGVDKRTRLRERFHTLHEEHEELEGWTLNFNENRRRAGVCRHTEQRIELARWTLDAPYEEVEDTLLHEVAHVLAGSEAGHGEEWKEVAEALGAKPERCYDDDLAEYRPEPEWYLVCGVCGTKLADRWRRTDVSGKGHEGCEGSTGCLRYVRPSEYRPGEQIVPTNDQEDRRAISLAAKQARMQVAPLLTESGDEDGFAVGLIETVIESRHLAPDHMVDRLVEELERLSRRARQYANRLRGLGDSGGGSTTVDVEIEEGERGVHEVEVVRDGDEDQT